ncbi:hypothetical protein BN1723_006048 [Verticillium longisporum]|uniref:ER membrane protein complex subunit 1 n=1 Tax=Verticillium longisporum TaxID=100787 RepID=A0A0G4ND96_VERLO|nr:hypothetical protein BN1723_006048 [Verticillium longisporum]
MFLPSVEGSAKEVVSWTFLPPGGQTIVEVATRASHDPVAQIGRVLGDRKVKYKYLNPNTAVVAATSAATSHLTIYLLDTVSGQILSSKTYEGVDASKTIDCAVAENWYACTFFGQYALKDAQGHALSGQSLKGYQIVVTDLYESNESNDRGPLGSAANFSSIETVDEPTGAPVPFLVSQAWVLSAPIVALAVTQTRQGITNRQLLGYQPETHGIAGLPRQVLEPRRTVGRDPTAQEVEAEGLIRYTPVIEVDPRQVITHQRDVIGVKDIMATPALLESTTLVFAYGIDIFGTRLAPSLSFDILGKGFDKVTLIGTVLALVAGVAALKPIWTPEQTVVVRSTDGGLKGLTWSGVEGSAKEVVSWTFLPPGGQTIVEVATRASHDPVAQIGRVLGDRKVKYKYLNPNTAVVAATSAATSTLTIYLLDTVSGQILSSKTYEGVDASKTIDCAVAENWYACTFFGQYALKDAQGHALSGQSLKGYQIVVTDLYESNESNDRGPLGSAANFSSIETVDEPTGAPTPFLVSQAWVLSAPIVALAVTQTRQGITNRQLLGYQPETHGIAGLPRQVLEPRRTVGRDPTAQEVEAEGLIRYTPVIEVDPRQVITHQRDVIGVKDIIATPALLESTTLVFAYGIDIFGTRLAPSLSFDILGKGFDKVTLIGTVLALVAGVAALKPIVRRKQTDLRWTAPR